MRSAVRSIVRVRGSSWRKMDSVMGNRVLLMQYGDRWREIRKLMHQVLATSGSNAVFAPFQDLESRQMMYEYLKQPGLFYKHNGPVCEFSHYECCVRCAC